jgi:hypothetical protein
MTTYGDLVYMLGGVPTVGGLGEVALAGGKWYFCDPTHGTANGDATTPETATNSLLTAYNMTRDGYNDGVIFIGGATAWNPAAMLTWSHSYTHLIGTSGLPGVGNRCRIVSQAATALPAPVTFSGSGCLIKNIQINNELATGTAGGEAIITGLRNIFQNVFFMNPSTATAASYAAKLSGSENVFVRCSFGQHTNPRAAASYGLWFYKGTGGANGNKFINCEFRSWASVTTHALVYVDVDVDNVAWNVQFENCLFDNLTIGGAGGTLAVAIDDNCATTDHQILMRGHNDVAGCTAVADPLTYVLQAEQGTGTQSGLLMATVNES